jgi:hypothetical protein
MQRLQTILAEILQEAGELKPLTLGPDSTDISVAPELKERVMERLFVQLKFNDRLIKLVVAMQFTVFLVALGLVYSYRDSPIFVSIIFGSSILSLLGITRSLSNLWSTKTAADVLIATLPRLSPELTVQAIKDLYYYQREPLSRSHTGTEQSKL